MRARTVALDCGSSRCVVGAFVPTADGELMLEDYALAPRDAAAEGVVLPELPEALLHRGRMVLVPPANLTVSKTIAVPPTARRKRAEIMRFEAAQAIPRPLPEVVWDAAPSIAGGNWVDLAAMKSTAAEDWCTAADRAGVRLEAMLPRANALLLTVRHNYPELRDRLLVAEVEGSTALLIWEAQGPSAVRLIGLPETIPVEVPAGGEFEESGEGGGAVAAGVPGMRVRRLAAEVTRLAETDGGADRPLVVFLSGTDAPACEEVASFVDALSVRVERLDPFRRVRLAKTANGAGALAHQFAVVVGAALAVRRRAFPNLLPMARRRENAFRRSRRWWLLSLAVLAICVWGTAWRLRVGTTARRAEAQLLVLGLVPWREAQQRLGDLQGELDRSERELEVLGDLEQARIGWVAWLAGVQEQLTHTEGIWIESMRVEEAAPAGAGGGLFGQPVAGQAAATGLRIAVAGCALDPGLGGRRGLERLRGLLVSLAALPGVAAVADERFDTSEPGVLRFSCIVEMKPGAAL